MGASVLINYREKPEWDVEVMAATAGRGASHVLELGGQDTFDRSVRAVAACGTIIQVGVLSGNDPTPHVSRLLWQNASILGLTVGSASHLAALGSFMERHALHPVIDATFEFDGAAQALDHLRSGAHFGKVVIGGATGSFFA